MDKQDFFQAMDNLFDGKTYPEMKESLDAIEDDWLDEYRTAKLSEVFYCENCDVAYQKSECVCKESTANTFVAILGFKKYYCPKCHKLLHAE